MVQLTMCPTCGKHWMKPDLHFEPTKIPLWKRIRIHFWNAAWKFVKNKRTEIHTKKDPVPIWQKKSLTDLMEDHSMLKSIEELHETTDEDIIFAEGGPVFNPNPDPPDLKFFGDPVCDCGDPDCVGLVCIGEKIKVFVNGVGHEISKTVLGAHLYNIGGINDDFNLYLEKPTFTDVLVLRDRCITLKDQDRLYGTQKRIYSEATPKNKVHYNKGSKGGVNAKPTTPRPPPPKGQGSSKDEDN